MCEGENAEPCYFRQFKLSSATIKPMGEEYKTVSLVKRTKDLDKNGKYDRVCGYLTKIILIMSILIKRFLKRRAKWFWCGIFKPNLRVLLILHFNDHQGATMHRNIYNKKINAEINNLMGYMIKKL